MIFTDLAAGTAVFLDANTLGYAVLLHPTFCAGSGGHPTT
jgi:hypothetical protein